MPTLNDALGDLQPAVLIAETRAWAHEGTASPLSVEFLLALADALEAATTPAPPVAGEPEREALIQQIIRDAPMHVSGEGLRIDVTVLEGMLRLAAGYRRQPAPREPERKVLRGVVGGVLCNASNFPERVTSRLLGQDMGPLIDRTVDALIAAGYRREPEPRVVTTVEELDALPLWSIVKGLNGVARRNPDGWTLDGYIYLRQSDDLEEYLIGPFLVLFAPGVE